MVTGLQLLGRANSEAAENAGVNSEYKEKQHLGSGSTYGSWKNNSQVKTVLWASPKHNVCIY